MVTLEFASGEPPLDAAAGRETSAWRDDAGVVRARTLVASGVRWIDWPAVGLFALEPGSHVVRVWASACASRQEVGALFNRVLRPVVLQALGWQALHASAVRGERGVVAICGQSGAGKSTLAYALRQDGFTQIADDGLVIGVEDDHVVAYALPFAPRLRPASQEHFARSPLGTGDGPAAGIDGIAETVAAVIVLNQDPHHPPSPACARIEPVRAFTALLTHAHCFDPESASATVALVNDYLRIAERVPVFAVRYAPGLERLSDLRAIAGGIAAGRSVNSPLKVVHDKSVP